MKEVRLLRDITVGDVLHRMADRPVMTLPDDEAERLIDDGQVEPAVAAKTPAKKSKAQPD